MENPSQTTAAFAREWWDRKQETFVPNRFLGVPCWQHPFDAWITQEIIFETRPEVLVECGSLGGGSAVLWATLMETYASGGPLVVAIDIEDRMDLAREVAVWDRSIRFLHGSSIDPTIVDQVSELTRGRRTMVILDSDHHQAHVTAELERYAGMVTPGCYLVVQDGITSEVDPDHGPGPLEAIEVFVASDDRFEIDRSRERMLFTFNPSGYLRRC